MERLLEDLDGLGGLRAVILSGMGEPFLHPGICDVIAAVKRRRLHLTVITNLLLVDSRRVLDLGVDQLLVGVHAASREAYEAFHPSFRNGEWETLLEKLRCFPRRGPPLQAGARDLLGQRPRAAGDGRPRRGDERRVGDVQAGEPQGGHGALRPRRSGAAAAPRGGRAAGAGGGRRASASRRTSTSSSGSSPRRATRRRRSGTRAASWASPTRASRSTATSSTAATRRSASARSRTGRGSPISGGAPRGRALRDRLRAGESFPGCAQCGKYNQNVALGRAFEARYGSRRLLEVTGRA